MPISKNDHKVVAFKLIFLWVIIYSVVIFYFEDIETISSLTENLSIQCFSILMGLIIGSVGILIGTMSELYNLLINFHNKSNAHENKSMILYKLKETISELKEDTLLLVKVFVINIIITYINKINLKMGFFSSLISPNLYPYLSKQAILTSTNLFLVIMGMWIVYDIISTMFTIHESYIVTLENNCNQN